MMKSLFILLLCFHAFASHAQHIGGIYTGKLTNDSTHKEQQYELALSEYRSQISGYAYTTFIVQDTFYYSIKRVRAKKEIGVLLVEDVKMLANNFPQAADKGVRQQMRIPLTEQDTIRELKGAWNTTQTKVFYAIGGSLALQREWDSSRSVLMRHLYEIDELQPNSKSKTFTASSTQSKASITANKALLSPTAVPYLNRKENIIQTVTAKGDSLVLSFYDNGLVDGDTISVYLNNQNIVSKTKLTAAAAKQIIKLQPSVELHKLMLVAENLGTIPPNTGLLVIQDGEHRYQIHFTADLQNNAVIEIKRRNE